MEPLVESETFAVERDERATPLMLAAQYGTSKTVQSLIDKNANAYARDINNWTALHYAAKGGNFFSINSDAASIFIGSNVFYISVCMKFNA